MSQCQQWGFQCIIPVIDDCTAKCTWRTTLEGDTRYTHMISNGDVDRQTNPDGTPLPLPQNLDRSQITYINNVPMTPYLFIACAGTWESLAETVSFTATDDLPASTVTLEYLVPPGRLDDARIPLAILKDSVIWHRRARNYAYRYDTYRTICMERSNFGGMENVGNTTIITEAALIDRYTSDSRLIYAHGVIIHEYEHNECGSDVTMESPFDLWLNEAFTVDVERTYLRTVFDPTFMRLREVDAIRAPGTGPLATEDGGVFGRIIRHGFNHPDELIDGLTYVKAPEVIAMLRLLLGTENFNKGVALYLCRYNGANANTAQFLACFEEVSGRNLTSFSTPWLESAGYPKVTAKHYYDPSARTLSLTLKQKRSGTGELFVVPITFAAVSESGCDLAETATTLILDCAEKTFTFTDIPQPAFLSINRNASFYGTFADTSATTSQLRLQVLHDPDHFNRVEAMRTLTDRERSKLIDALLSHTHPDELAGHVSTTWLDVYLEIIRDLTLPDGLKGYLLQIDEQPLNRNNLHHVRECWQARQILLRAVARHASGEIMALLANTDTRCHADATETQDLSAGIERRFLAAALMEPLVAADTVLTQRALEAHYCAALNTTDRLNALSAINRTSHQQRHELVAAAGDELRPHLNGYIGWLNILGRSHHADVLKTLDQAAAHADFDPTHPGLNRALYIPFSLNNARLWTEEGLTWLTSTVIALAPLSETTALRLIAPLQQVHNLASDLQPLVIKALKEMQAAITPAITESVHGRLSDYLSQIKT
jgi:aminopeptidase N